MKLRMYYYLFTNEFCTPRLAACTSPIEGWNGRVKGQDIVWKFERIGKKRFKRDFRDYQRVWSIDFGKYFEDYNELIEELKKNVLIKALAGL